MIVKHETSGWFQKYGEKTYYSIIPDGVYFFFDFPAVPKGRPRFTTRGRFPMAYTPIKTREFQKIVRSISENIFSSLKIPAPFFKPPARLKFTIIIYTAVKFGPRAGDCDNYAKSIMDALNGIIYSDDYMVSELSIHRVCNGEVPEKQRKSFIIHIEELKNGQ